VAYCINAVKEQRATARAGSVYHWGRTYGLYLFFEISLFYSRMSVPARPDPPIVGKVTHNSIELYWKPPEKGSPEKGDGRLRYCIQEEEVGSKSKGFGNVYSGYSTNNIFEGLEPRTQYRYRMRCTNNQGNSAWSVVVSVSTTTKPKTSEDLQKAVAKNDLETVVKILPCMKTYKLSVLINYKVF
jgi:hypothetical protein